MSDKLKVFCPTQDEWSGNHPGNTVEVAVFDCNRGMKGSPPLYWRVSVFGNDDIGVCKDFGDDEAGARALYETIIAMPYVNMVPLFDLGMEFF